MKIPDFVNFFWAAFGNTDPVISHSMERFFRKEWTETTGETLTESWGTCIFYFETDDERFVVRQIQVYESGHVLKYDFEYVDDEFGGLADQQLQLEEFSGNEISEKKFTSAWQSLKRNT
jgi:hypothetical protein